LSRSDRSLPITAENISKSFSGKTVWSGLSFRVDSGEMVAVTGPSGSGKSTLLNCIGMLERPSEGRLTAGEIDLARAGPAARTRYFRQDVGFLFQNYGLVEPWTVRDNLWLALEYSHLSRRQKIEAINEALARVHLGDICTQKIFALSGGEQQRVSLARLILKKPRIVLADEPSAALDRDNVSTVMRVLIELKTQGAAVILATHDDDLPLRCDRIISLVPAKVATKPARA
jgi:putative ABC transport system ATP-binding protein